MMRAVRPRRSVVEAMAREGYEKKFPKGRPSSPSPANIGPTLALIGDEKRVLPYRGRGYELGYVSFEDGLRLAEASAAIKALGEEDPTPAASEAYLDAMRLVVRMAPRYLLPVEPVRRLFWRLRLMRNPFRRATDAEVGHLLGFFLASQMRSRVRFPTPAGGDHTELMS